MKAKFKKNLILPFLCAALIGAAGLSAAQTDRVQSNAQEVALKAENFIGAVDLDGKSVNAEYAPDEWTRYVADSSETFWDFHDGVATSKSDMFATELAYSNYVYLGSRVPVRYAEIEATIRQESVRSVNGGTVNGWSGLYFGIEDTTRRPYWPNNPHGGMFFCQPQGFATYSGHALNASEWTEEKDGEKNMVNDFILTSNAVHKLRIYKNHVEYYVNGNLYWDLSTADDFAALGECGVVVTNQSFTVSSFSVKVLSETGEEAAAPESIELPALPAHIEPFRTIPFAPTLAPATAGQEYSVSCSPEGGEYDYAGKTLRFTREGQYTVTVSSLIDGSVAKTIQVTVSPADTEGYLSLPFGSERMSAYYIPSGEAGVEGAPADFSSLFTVEDGILSRRPQEEWDTEPSAHYTTLYFNGLPDTNFAVQYIAKTDGAEGWHGLVFASSDKNRAGNQSGATLFTQANGRSTYWSGADSPMGSEGPTEKDPPLYDSGSWNKFLFKVYGKAGNYTAALYVNDMETPTMVKSGLNDVSGGFGVFFSGRLTAQVGELQYGFLDEEGTLISYVPAQSVEFTAKAAEMEVGDTFALEAQVLPATATHRGVVFSSDDPLVAQVDGKGTLRAISAGTTVIRVAAQDNEQLSDSFTLTVKESLVEITGVSIANKSDFSSMTVGENNVRLNVVLLPEGAEDPDLTFTSSDETVATVTSAGTVVAVGAGTAVITVTTSNGKTDSVTVTVSAQTAQEESGCGAAVTGSAFMLVLLASALFPMVKKKNNGV